MPGRAVVFFAIAAALLLGGCAADLSSLKNDPSLPPAASIENLKPFQQDEHQCGAAALATVLLWAGFEGETPQTLAPLVYTPKKEGSFLFDLAREARNRGFLAFAASGGLKALLAEVGRGKPAIVLENRGLGLYPVFHYSVAAGYDLSRETITLLEGEEKATEHSLGVFANTFGRSGSHYLLILRSGELPATESPTLILQGIADLEKAAGSKAALPYLQSYKARFPENWLGRFALGNSCYAAGDKKCAEEEFLSASQISPERPEPLNNLALLKKEAGMDAQAVEFAKRAVEKALSQGLDHAPYEETLREVREK